MLAQTLSLYVDVLTSSSVSNPLVYLSVKRRKLFEDPILSSLRPTEKLYNYYLVNNEFQGESIQSLRKSN